MLRAEVFADGLTTDQVRHDSNNKFDCSIRRTKLIAPVLCYPSMALARVASDQDRRILFNARNRCCEVVQRSQRIWLHTARERRRRFRALQCNSDEWIPHAR